MGVARYFDSEKYDGSTPLVGLTDIDEAEWEALPKHVQEQVDSLAYFRKTKPSRSRSQAGTEANDTKEA